MITGNQNTRIPLVSIIIPTRNEEKSISALADAINQLIEESINSSKFTFEFIIIDNASTDNTWHDLKLSFSSIESVKLFKHVRNMGFQGSIFSGLRASKGDAAVVLQSDLQDPPHLILQMIACWLNGDKYVATRIRKRNSSYIDKKTRNIAYIMLNILAGVKIEKNSGDFWLIDRTLIDQLVITNNLRPFFRTAIPRLQAPDKILNYDRKVREHGTSNFNLLAKYEFFMDGLLSDARKFSMYFFVFISAIGIVSIANLMIALPILISNPPPRIHHFSTIFSILGLVGLIVSILLFTLLILLEYVQRIYSETSLNVDDSYIVQSSK
jgi:dolichol-phosphate mannosyltransferase